MKTLCLCMIIKDEIAVVLRALGSIKNHINYWVICDTGSTDQTRELILQYLGNIPGELHQKRWVNFGHNRTEAIQLAYRKSDYILVMDADMIANVEPGFKENLIADYYEIRYTGDVDYSQPMLVSGRIQWQYHGVTHEYIDSPQAQTSGVCTGLTLTHVGDGGNKADKFERDIALLEAEIQQNPDNLRSLFYLAQSYKDHGEHELAYQWYCRRIEAGQGWEEEYWYAMYQKARMQQRISDDWPSTLQSYLDAYQLRPSRLEPLYEIVCHHRTHEQYQMAYLFSSRISHQLSYPSDRLFIEKPVYQYLFPLEHAVAASAVGHISEAIEFFNRVLQKTALPEWVVNAAVQGRRLCLDAAFPGKQNPIITHRNIRVLVPFHNPGASFDRCIKSLARQRYRNHEVIFFDDASSDQSGTRVSQLMPEATLVTGKVKQPLAFSFHQLLTEYCDADDIVVHVDADDWLTDEDVLTDINDCYNRHDCWLMYGQFRNSDGQLGFSQPFPSAAALQALRSGHWRTSHIRTYRARLYHRISEQDPGYSCLKNSRGEWFESAVDAAMTMPMIEMAGFDRIRFSDRIAYIYNVDNPTSVSKTHPQEQLNNYIEIQRKRPFSKIQGSL